MCCSPKKLVTQTSLTDSKDVKAMLTRLGYVEEDKHFVPTVNVRAASVDKLALLTIDCFSE